MEQDIRWKQRYSNFKKAFARLREVVENNDVQAMSELEKAGLVQFFEMTYELAWKTMQDLLKANGYTGMFGPNPILAQALQDGLITNHDGWQDMKNARNELSHDYSETKAEKIIVQITDEFYVLLRDLDTNLQSRCLD